jgi:hypothetical protein
MQVRIATLFTGTAIAVSLGTRSMLADENSSRLLEKLVGVLILVSILISLLNALGIVFDQSFGGYFLVLALTFSISVLYLFRLFQTSFYSARESQ